MPDTRRHRGPHPEDERLFCAKQLPTLQAAVEDFSWLLSKAYGPDSALKLVGDRYDLTSRQRMALMRSSCSDESLCIRRERCMRLEDLAGGEVAVDGYNLLITIESALSRGVILEGRDGCYRDLASVHGTYRKVEETLPAIDLIFGFLERQGVRHVRWLLDSPVSNSGRLRAMMEDHLAGRTASATIELVHNPDRCLAECEEPVVSSDSWVLDRCNHWVNLAREIVACEIPAAWVVRLGDT